MSCAMKLMFAVCVFITMVSAECPVKCHCTRYKTLCALAELNSLPTQLPSSTELVRIEVDRISEINSTVITHCGLRNLTRLELINVHLNVIQPGAFRHMNQLEYLVIRHNNMTVLKTNTFQHLEQLYYLDLSYNNILEMESGTFAGLHSIRHLDIGYNYIKPLYASAFEGMRNINNCSLTNVPVLVFTLRYYNIEPALLRYLCTFTIFKVGPTGIMHMPKHVTFGLTITRYLSVAYPEEMHLLSNYNLLPGIIFKNISHESSELLYIDLSQGDIGELRSILFQNLKHLKYLDLSLNAMTSIESGTFKNLKELTILKLNYNYITSLTNGSFRGLESLNTLEIIQSNIITIEGDTFRELFKLQVLDLSLNYIQTLESNTFTGLQMLKEIKLYRMVFNEIDSSAFSDFKYLKSSSNTLLTEITVTEYVSSTESKYSVKYFSDFFRGHVISDYKLPNVDTEILVTADRLDSIGIMGSITLSKESQVLKSIELYIDAKSTNSQQAFRDTLLSAYYVRELNLTLIGGNLIEILGTFPDPRISKLTLLNSDLSSLSSRSNNLIRFPNLKYLTIYEDLHSIPKEAFILMSSLEELTIQYKTNVTYEHCSFCGLVKLKQLRIFCELQYISSENPPNKCLNADVLVGLDNLKHLHLKNNHYTCLSRGAFHGLHSIEEIHLNFNQINSITPGVFGATCDEKFEKSCKNVTSLHYCNNTNALKTLKYLNLADNKISHIHPLAFASCTNLQTLDLSFNLFLTLNNTFLYTPALRHLNMTFCGINEIQNNTFVCTPLLSTINFSYNRNMTRLTVDTLLPLRNLQSINLKQTDLLCNCELRETWLWMRNNRVHYEFIRNITDNTSLCGTRELEQVLSEINCNVSTVISTHKHFSNSTINDFAFFKKYIEPIVLIIIFISGLTCNSFLLFIALRHSEMRTIKNACIIQLAVVDILSLIINLPLSYWDVINVRWEFDDTTCKIFIFSKDMIVVANVFTVISLSVERFLVAGTFKDLKKVDLSKIVPMTWLLLMTWICAIVLSLPAYFSATVEIRCLYSPPGNQDYIRNVWTFQLIMYCLLAGIALTFFNIKTSLFLRESIRKIPGEIKNNMRAKNRKTVANIVLILLLVFAISYLPNYILRVLVAWSVLEIENIFLISFFTYCLFFLNAVFNPVSLFIMSSKFKAYALSYFPFLGK